MDAIKYLTEHKILHVTIKYQLILTHTVYYYFVCGRDFLTETCYLKKKLFQGQKRS